MSNQPLTQRTETFSAASLIAVVAAILSFPAGALGGFFLALAAIVFGLFGVLIAMSPEKRGGIASTMAVIAGGAGIVAAVIKLLVWIF